MQQSLCENWNMVWIIPVTLYLFKLLLKEIWQLLEEIDLNLCHFRLSFAAGSSSCESFKVVALTVGGKSLHRNVTVPQLSLRWVSTHGCYMSVHPPMVKGLVCSQSFISKQNLFYHMQIMTVPVEYFNYCIWFSMTLSNSILLKCNNKNTPF